MLTASNTEGSTYAYSFQHNGAGQVTSVTKPFAGASLSFGYDLAGNRTTVSDSFGGTESLGYDADNNLTTLTYGDASDSLSISFTYNQANQMTQEQMYSSGTLIATVAETYDGAGNVKNITYENSSSAVIDSFSYIYDQANELMSEMDSSGATTMNYTYNDLGELTAAGLQVYSYDAAGNPNSGADGLVGGIAPSSAGNELSEYVVPSDIPTIAGDTITYTYDTAGNEMTAADLTASTTWSYGYDNANHITSAMETVSGTLTESVGYVYDVFGNLIRETVVPYSGGMSGTPTTMDFLMDGWNPAKAGATGNAGFDTWAVLNGSSGLVETRNIQGNGIDQILARIDNASHGASDTGLFFDLTDRLGSVRYVLSSTSDTTIATINYDAWGNILTAPSTSMGMYAWDGYDYDAVTKLYLDNARDYDSVSERWLSQDPMGFDAGDSNLYRYVNNSPLDGVDPSGDILIAQGEQQKDSFLKDLAAAGKKDVPVLDLGNGTYYIHTDRSNAKQLFAYANKRWSAIWEDPKATDKAKELGASRNVFLRASGILGDLNAYEIVDVASLKAVELNAQQKNKLNAFRDNILTKIKNPAKVVFDFGGEGFYDSANSVNISLWSAWKSTTPGEDRKNNGWYYMNYNDKKQTDVIKDKSVDAIYCENSPLVTATLDLFFRIIKPGGTISVFNSHSYGDRLLKAAKVKYPGLTYTQVEEARQTNNLNEPLKEWRTTVTIPK